MSRRHDVKRWSARGFTLAECALALGISSILIVGAGVVLTGAVKSVDRGAGAAEGARKAAGALQVLGSDVTGATLLTVDPAKSIVMEVPDRDEDGRGETITYEWGGTSGQPLYRVYNGTRSRVLDDVRAVEFGAVTRAGPLVTTSAEGNIKSFVASGATDYEITSSNILAIALRPEMPSRATSWQITRIQLSMRKSGATDSTLQVKVYEAGAGLLPTGRLLASTTLPEASLGGTASTVTLALPTGAIDASKAVTIVIGKVENSVNPVCRMDIGTTATQVTNLLMMTSSDGGVTWSGADTSPLPTIRVAGMITRTLEQ